jgi:hypothetical protein
MALTPSQKRIAAMLKARGRKVTVIDETKDPKVVADEVLRVAQDHKRRLLCPSCGDYAIDGKVTCGRAECGSSTGQDR